jgi:hypothetical protein
MEKHIKMSKHCNVAKLSFSEDPERWRANFEQWFRKLHDVLGTYPQTSMVLQYNQILPFLHPSCTLPGPFLYQWQGPLHVHCIMVWKILPMAHSCPWRLRRCSTSNTPITVCSYHQKWQTPLPYEIYLVVHLRQ